MDVALSTQTNDLVGQVRTTGKLPLYLACGLPVLASHVGEAAALLGPVGWTLPYHGVVDRDYPTRLAEKIEVWRLDPDGEQDRRQTATRLAAEAFDIPVMRERLTKVIGAVAA
jgi:glycosyltransferase involved in cell wall biosynthesis